MIKIKVMNKELKEFQEWKSGFSLLIEKNNIKLLFDTSINNEIIEKTITIKNIDFIVLSHGHFDHTNDLMKLNHNNAKIITHPKTIKKRKWNKKEVGPNWSLNQIKEKFSQVILTQKPFKISKDITFLGQINFLEFPIDPEIDIFEDGSISKYEDESAIAIKSKKGLIIITGCSHKDIRNIIEHAKIVTNEKKIYAVIGGFHIFNLEKAREIISYFEKNKIKIIKPMHCLSKEAFNLFKKHGFNRLKSEEEIIFQQ